MTATNILFHVRGRPVDLTVQKFKIQQHISQIMLCSKVLIGELYIFSASVLFAIDIIASRRATRNTAGPATFKAWTHILSTLFLFILRYPLKSTLNSNIGDGKEPEHIEFLVRVKKGITSFIDEYTFDLYFWGTISGATNFCIAIFFQYGLLTVEGIYILKLTVINFVSLLKNHY